MGKANEREWAEAKHRCRLNEDDIRKARELGFTPHALIRNIPNRSQGWTQPVNAWVREMHEERFGRTSKGPAIVIPIRGPARAEIPCDAFDDLSRTRALDPEPEKDLQ